MACALFRRLRDRSLVPAKSDGLRGTTRGRVGLSPAAARVAPGRASLNGGDRRVNMGTVTLGMETEVPTRCGMFATALLVALLLAAFPAFAGGGGSGGGRGDDTKAVHGGKMKHGHHGGSGHGSFSGGHTRAGHGQPGSGAHKHGARQHVAQERLGK